MSLKFFHYHLNFWGHWEARTQFKKMVMVTTKSTHFMQTFIRDWDFEVSQRGRNRQRAWKRFGDINVNTNPSKTTFLPKEGVMINPYHFPNGFQQIGQNLLNPKFPR